MDTTEEVNELDENNEERSAFCCCVAFTFLLYTFISCRFLTTLSKIDQRLTNIEPQNA